MSNALFPLALIKSVRSTPNDRTLADEFEAGNMATRNVWPRHFFKRQFVVETTPLTVAEFRYLRSFFYQMGTVDSFWFRDNVGRDGNAKVRFSKPFPRDRDPGSYTCQFELEEIAPVRNLIEWDELTTAAGATPVLGYDASREIYLYDQGAATVEAAAYDFINFNYPAPWVGGLNLNGITGQYQSYNFNGFNYAKTAGNVALTGGTKPACTIFALVAIDVSAVEAGTIFAVGGTGATACMALISSIDTGVNYFTPYIGGTGAFTAAKVVNTGAWQTLCVTFPAGADGIKLYKNGALIGTNSVARAYAAGKAYMGFNPASTILLNNGADLTISDIGVSLLFNAELSADQVAAVHALVWNQRQSGGLGGG